MGVELGSNNVVYLHLTLVPYIVTAGELKSKPTQHSVKELLSLGIQPDILLCRTDRMLPEDMRRKIALFTNVPVRAVISAMDVDNIYKIPRLLHEQGLDEIVAEKLHFNTRRADLSEWDKVIYAMEHPTAEVDIALVGKYVHLTESYKSLSEALKHAGIHTRTRVNIRYIDSEMVDTQGTALLDGADAILVPGGFGERGVEGKIKTAQYAREHGIPYLGICLGMQLAVVEFARNVAGLKGAHSTEFNAKTPHPVIAMITEWITPEGAVEKRSAGHDLGGTMRLGGQECRLLSGTRAHESYGREIVVERHRHRYEFNNNYRQLLQDKGLTIAGTSLDDRLVEIVELPGHPWFIGVQFHPEFTSRPRDGHPLFSSYVLAARARRSGAVTEPQAVAQ